MESNNSETKICPICHENYGRGCKKGRLFVPSKKGAKGGYVHVIPEKNRIGNLNLNKCCIHSSKCKCHACKPCKNSTDICRRCFSCMVIAKSSEQGYFKPWKLECPLCRGNYFPRVFVLNMYLLMLGNFPGSDVDRPQTLGKYIRSRLSSDENINMITFIYPKNHINIW